MSFSTGVKEELAKRIDPARHCNLAELSAILLAGGYLGSNGENGGRVLALQTENPLVAEKYRLLLKKIFRIDPEVLREEKHSSRKSGVFSVCVREDDGLGEILSSLKIDEERRDSVPELRENSLIAQKDCCKRAFIRGSFLAAGSISDPRKGYHFEIVCQTGEKAERLRMFIQSFHIDAKTVVRKKSYVVYVKEGAQIVDLLALMGAGVAVMDLENIRILKDIANSVNRKVNCETANINKTVNAAVRQMEDIRMIRDSLGFENLSEGLGEIALLRLQYPEASLKELGLMLNPQVGKSGVNHRLRKLSEIAGKLRESREEQE